ncbi:hypothetical protein U1Q18_045175 [Sarracenia purpurea var. burkii]
MSGLLLRLLGGFSLHVDLLRWNPKKIFESTKPKFFADCYASVLRLLRFFRCKSTKSSYQALLNKSLESVEVHRDFQDNLGFLLSTNSISTKSFKTLTDFALVRICARHCLLHRNLDFFSSSPNSSEMATSEGKSSLRLHQKSHQITAR